MTGKRTGVFQHRSDAEGHTIQHFRVEGDLSTITAFLTAVRTERRGWGSGRLLLSEVAMKILVTGATGFIGRHLIRHLDASGYGVRAMVRPTSNTEGFPAGLEYAHATLEDLDALRHAVSGVDVVIHLACLLKVPWKPEFQTVNVDGTRRVLEACAERPGFYFHLFSRSSGKPKPD